MTVRDSDSSVVQFLYGEDGMDISKSQFLKTKQFPFLSENASSIIPNNEFLDQMKDNENYESVMKHKKKVRKIPFLPSSTFKNMYFHFQLRSWLKKNPVINKRRETSFLKFSNEIRSDIELKKPAKTSKKTGRRKIDEQIVKLWNEADDELKLKYSKKCIQCPDPVISRYQPDSNFNSLSEHIEGLVASYMKSMKIDTQFENVIAVKSMKSLAAPGELTLDLLLVRNILTIEKNRFR